MEPGRDIAYRNRHSPNRTSPRNRTSRHPLTIIPGILSTVIPAPLYRHSRVSGNPAVACQDYGIIGQYRPGFPLTRE